MANMVQSFLVPFFGTVLIGYFVLGQSGKFLAMLCAMMATLFACVGLIVFASTKNSEYLVIAMYAGVLYFLVDCTYRLAEKRKFKGAFDRIMENTLDKAFKG